MTMLIEKLRGLVRLPLVTREANRDPKERARLEAEGTQLSDEPTDKGDAERPDLEHEMMLVMMRHVCC